MTHLCSFRVTRTKNTICHRARKAASDIIHAEGVRFAVGSSAPQARKVLSLREDIGVPVRTTNHPTAGQARSAPCLARRQNGVARRQMVFTWPWCWVTCGEQSMVISRERRRCGLDSSGAVTCSSLNFI
jgi:hypothetical protein